jgi:hypothetical protein
MSGESRAQLGSSPELGSPELSCPDGDDVVRCRHALRERRGRRHDATPIPTGNSARRHSGETTFEASRRPAATAQQTDRVVCHHAVGAPAVGDDLDVVRNRRQVVGELVDGNRSCAGDVSGGELGRRPHVDHDHLTGRHAGDEFLSADLVQPAAVAEVRSSELVEPIMVRCGDIADGRPQFGDLGRREAVEDPGAVPAGRHETTGGE